MLFVKSGETVSNELKNRADNGPQTLRLCKVATCAVYNLLLGLSAGISKSLINSPRQTRDASLSANSLRVRVAIICIRCYIREKGFVFSLTHNSMILGYTNYTILKTRQQLPRT